MNVTPEHNEKIAKMTFSSVYPHYVTKIEKKGRTIAELHEVITWLTGYNEEQLQKLINHKTTFKDFFENAKLNLNAQYEKTLINLPCRPCNYRLQKDL